VAKPMSNSAGSFDCVSLRSGCQSVIRALSLFRASSFVIRHSLH